MTHVKFKTQPSSYAFNNLMENFFTPFASLYRDDVPTSSWKQVAPANVKELDNSYELEIVAPGFDKEAFKIDLNQSTLTISAEVTKKEENKTEKQIRTEYKAQSFKRSFNLDETIEIESISAQYVNGILTLNLPKKGEVKPQIKQITVQ